MSERTCTITKLLLVPLAALFLSGAFFACKPAGANGPRTPAAVLNAPDLFDQVLVQIKVTYDGASSREAKADEPEDADGRSRKYRGEARVSWEPKEAVTIYFLPENAERYHAPRQVRWVIHGLRKGHTVRISPKEGSRGKLFPALARNSRADSQCDSILSGHVDQEIFYRADADDGKKDGVARWNYNIEVYDAQGERIGGYDPEVIIKKHP